VWMQVHHANMKDSREGLNTLAQVGPEAVACVSADIAAAITALNHSSGTPVQGQGPNGLSWGMLGVLGLEELTMQMQRGSELGIRATEAILKSSLTGRSSASASLAGEAAGDQGNRGVPSTGSVH
jgi:hypothetical protein